MAEKLETWTFRERNTKYPWDEWFDGSPWRLIKGTDFSVSVESMQVTVSVSARRRGGKARTSSVDGGLVIQFYRPDPA